MYAKMMQDDARWKGSQDKTEDKKEGRRRGKRKESRSNNFAPHYTTLLPLLPCRCYNTAVLRVTKELHVV